MDHTEVVLADNIRIHCGNEVLPWYSLFVFFDFATAAKDFFDRGWHGHHGLRSIAGVDISIFKRMDDLLDGDVSYVKGSRPLLDRIIISVPDRLRQRRRLKLKAGEKPTQMPESDLFLLVQAYQDSRCTDLRDKAFGLHSFALPCCRSSVPVDYTQSPYSLCNQLLKHHIYHHLSTNDSITIVNKSQNLHRLMGGASQLRDPVSPSASSVSVGSAERDGYGFGSEKTDLVDITENVRGTISYVSPPFKHLSVAGQAPVNGAILTRRLRIRLDQISQACLSNQTPISQVENTIDLGRRDPNQFFFAYKS